MTNSEKQRGRVFQGLGGGGKGKQGVKLPVERLTNSEDPMHSLAIRVSDIKYKPESCKRVDFKCSQQKKITIM